MPRRLAALLLVRDFPCKTHIAGHQHLDESLLRSARVMAARKGTSDSEIMEAALREFLGMETLDRVWGRTDLSAEDALKLAVDEVHKYRAGQ